MAAPQRYYRSTLPTEPAWPGRIPGRRRAGQPRHSARRRARSQRRFALLVIVPVLLMLGSVYMHTVAARLDSRSADLRMQLDAARAQGERLEVEVAKLSAADRVRPLASEKLGMRDARSADLEVYRGEPREDGTTHAGEERGGGRP